MISWIQKTFQQHFRLIFLVLLGIVIVAFVFTIGASPGLGRADQRAVDRPFYGANLGKPEDQRRMFGDAQLSVFLQAGFPALGEAQLQQYGLQRHAALSLANDLGVPRPTAGQLADFVKTLRAFAGNDGAFDARRYAQFRDNLKLQQGLTEADVSRVLADDLRYDSIQKLLAGPGYVLGNEVKQQLTRAETAWTLAVATADYSAFAPAIAPLETDLAKHLEENVFRYEIPPMVRARLVAFPASAYLASVQLDDAAVRAFYDSNPARFPKPTAAAADGAPTVQLAPTSGGDADYAVVRPQVEAALRLERARTLAAKAASDLTLALFEGKVPREGVDAFLSARKLAAAPVAPFARNALPPELAGSPENADQAFRLNAGRYFTDALATPAGSAVLLWEESIPTRQPSLVEVRERVEADYRESEKRSRFIAAGKAARSLIEAQLAAGAGLEKAVTAASSSGLALTVRTLPAFTLRDAPQDLDQAVLGALQNLEKGRLSEMVVSGQQGFLVHAVEKQVPVVDETNPRFLETRTQLARMTAARNGSEILNGLVERELARSAPTLP
jgi:peptidyl-prolyl cis-trans isomerase D